MADYDINSWQNPESDEKAPTRKEGLRSPQGKYDNIVNLILFFPLRLVMFFIFGWMMFNHDSDNYFATPFFALLSLVELAFAPVTKVIKVILLKLVERAENNAKEL